MSQYKTDSVAVISTAQTALASGSPVGYGVEIDLYAVVGGRIHLGYSFSTAPTAGKTLDIYGLFSAAPGGTFDDWNPAQCTKLGSITVDAVTGSRAASIPLDPAALGGRAMMLVLVNNGTGQSVVINSLTVVRKLVE